MVSRPDLAHGLPVENPLENLLLLSEMCINISIILLILHVLRVPAKQGSKLTLASSHFASEFHQTASAKLYHTHFSATRTLAPIIHNSHQNSV